MDPNFTVQIPYSTIPTSNSHWSDVSETWYYPDMTSAEATDALYGFPNGTFLIRNSTQQGNFTATYVIDNALQKALILSSSNGYSFDTSESGFYPSMNDLVKSNADIFRVPYKPTLPPGSVENVEF